MKYFKKTMLAGCVALSASVGGAGAASINSLIDYGPTIFEDDWAEYLWIDNGTTGLIEVGDVLRGILDIQEILNVDTSTSAVLGGANNSLSAIFAVQVVQVTDDAFGDATLKNFVFQPYVPFASEFLTDTGSAVSGAVAYFYEDTADNWTITAPGCTDASPGANCEGNVTDGTLWAAGFIDPGEVADGENYWLARGSQDVNNPSTSPGQSFSFAFSVLEFTSVDFEERIILGHTYTGSSGAVTTPPDLNPGSGNGMADIAGIGNISAYDPTGSPYDVVGDVDAVGYTVPEPGIVLLMGAGLLGVGFSSRKRRDKKMVIG